MNDHGALFVSFESHCLASLPRPSIQGKRKTGTFPWRSATSSDKGREPQGSSSPLPVTYRSGRLPSFLWAIALALFLVSGSLPGQAFGSAPSSSGSIEPFSSSLANLPVSPLSRVPGSLAGIAESGVTEFWGLTASLIDIPSRDLDYSDLFCLHSDSGPGPRLECHHDDPPLTAPGTWPPFLTSVQSSPRELFAPIPNRADPLRKSPTPLLSPPTLPPRGLLV
ncbi:MAG: hypothetical protein ACP5OP_04845 [Leptospirillia bacterium]